MLGGIGNSQQGIANKDWPIGNTYIYIHIHICIFIFIDTYTLPGRQFLKGRLEHVRNTVEEITSVYLKLTPKANNRSRVRSKVIFSCVMVNWLIKKLYVLNVGTVRRTKRSYTIIPYNDPSCIHGLEMFAPYLVHLRNSIFVEFVPTFISVNQILFPGAGSNCIRRRFPGAVFVPSCDTAVE